MERWSAQAVALLIRTTCGSAGNAEGVCLDPVKLKPSRTVLAQRSRRKPDAI